MDVAFVWHSPPATKCHAFEGLKVSVSPHFAPYFLVLTQCCCLQDLGKLTCLRSYVMCCGHSARSSLDREEADLKAALSRLPNLNTLYLLGKCSGLVRGVSREISGLSQLMLDYRCIEVCPLIRGLTMINY